MAEDVIKVQQFVFLTKRASCCHYTCYTKVELVQVFRLKIQARQFFSTPFDPLLLLESFSIVLRQGSPLVFPLKVGDLLNPSKVRAQSLSICVIWFAHVNLLMWDSSLVPSAPSFVSQVSVWNLHWPVHSENPTQAFVLEDVKLIFRLLSSFSRSRSHAMKVR